MFELTPEILLRAYASGIFPMAESRNDPNLYWIDPETRGVLPLERFHVPRSLRRTLKRRPFRVSCDTAFEQVIRRCAEYTEARPNTWINEDIIRLYGELHRLGHAHSVESWQNGRLVGGLYGVTLGGAFFGESMFTRVTDASKVALVHLVARLRRGGFVLLDTQFMSRHLERFGTIEITRADYHMRLAEALRVRATFYPELDEDVESAFLQSTTQTS